MEHHHSFVFTEDATWEDFMYNLGTIIFKYFLFFIGIENLIPKLA